MALIVVERLFENPQDLKPLQDLESENSWCLDQNSVRFCFSYFSNDRKRMLCLYEAPDAEAVRRAQSTIGMPFERIYAAEALGPEPSPEATD